GLGPHPPSIDIEGLPGHERGIVAGEEGQRADQIVGYFHALDRLHLCDRGKFLVHRLEAGAWFARECAGRTREPWRNCVDGDAVGSEIGSEHACKATYPTLARDIVGKAGNDRAESARCHIDYPAPFARPSTKAAVTRKAPSRLIERTLRQSAKVMSRKFFCGKMPAQFTTISTCPNLPCTCFAIAATPVSEDTSQFTASACRPVASTNFTVSCPSVRSAIATCTPSSANRLAKACPMPLAPPVITATLSLWPFAI